MHERGLRRLALGLIVLAGVGEAIGITHAVVTGDYSKLPALTAIMAAGAGLSWHAGFGMGRGSRA